MASTRRILVVVLSSLLISACAASHPGRQVSLDLVSHPSPDTPAPQDPGKPLPQHSASPAQQELSSGVASFENKDFKSSGRALMRALQLGLGSRQEQVEAHKYLAFIGCVTHRKTQCHMEFMAALEIDPSFTLGSAEAGHPIWGPIFRAAKARHGKTLLARDKPQ